MGRYDFIQEFQSVRSLLVKVTPMDPDRVAKLRSAHPRLPSAYLDLLGELGFGNYGGAFSIYSGLSSPEDVYGKPVPDNLKMLLLFGDDFQGFCYGFDPQNDYALVEVAPTTIEAILVGESFEEFVRATFLRDE